MIYLKNIYIMYFYFQIKFLFQNNIIQEIETNSKRCLAYSFILFDNTMLI